MHKLRSECVGKLREHCAFKLLSTKKYLVNWGQFYTACFSRAKQNNNNKYMKRTPYESILHGKSNLGPLQIKFDRAGRTYCIRRRTFHVQTNYIHY